MSDLGEWDDTTSTDQPDGDNEAAPLYFNTLTEFVEEMIIGVFMRPTGERKQFHWAADWWRHPEAVLRLDALWRSWEHLRLDPATGMSVWLRDHADYHLAILMSPDGPFGKSEDSSQHNQPLPHEPPPEGLLDWVCCTDR